jgi:hypothetical protein
MKEYEISEKRPQERLGYRWKVKNKIDLKETEHEDGDDLN